jgi:hypothetical protein
MPQAKNVSGTLIAHAGAVKIERGGLLSLSVPARTLTHRPVAHSTVIDLIEQRLGDHQIFIEKAEYAVMTDGLKLFAALVLKRAVDDFAFALGLRTSNDKTMAMELVAGARVFVCDNMALSGDADILCRKHTSLFDPRTAIFAGIDRAVRKFDVLENRIKALKGQALSDLEAKAMICDSVVKGVLPAKMLAPVHKAYFDPPHAEFEARTMWSLQNAYTETAKLIEKPNIALEFSQAVGAMFLM